VIRVPETSNLVLVSGEVLFPNALVFEPEVPPIDATCARRRLHPGRRQGACGGDAAGRQRGRGRPQIAVLQAGDEIMVLPKIETKNVEVDDAASRRSCTRSRWRRRSWSREGPAC
jgi:hypothetical protein